MSDQIQCSVIVPTYNRVAQLRTVVSSVMAQDFSGSFEIIVINDGSTDGTMDFLTEMEKTGKLIALHQNNQGPSAARNLGIQHACGTLVAFIDDDCEAPKDWLSSFARVLEEDSIAGCGGVTTSHPSVSLFGLTVDHMVNFFKLSVNILPHVTTGKEAPFLTSNNVAYRVSALRQIGGFDRRFRIGAEERDLNNRLVRAGHRLLFVPSLSVVHCHRATLKGFLKHQFDQGKGSYRLYHQADTSTQSQPIPATTYLQLLSSPFGKFGMVKGLAVSVLIIVAHAMIVLGYLAASLETQSGRG